MEKLGCEMLDWMWERGWDEECGGLFYFRDVHGKPVQEYWHDMKFWWPHDEALIARAMSEGAAETWILADHSKIGAASRETYCPAERIDRLFCNGQARQAEGFEALRTKVGEVILA